LEADLPLINHFALRSEIHVMESHYRHSNPHGYRDYLRRNGWNAVEQEGEVIVYHVQDVEPDEKQKLTNRQLLAIDENRSLYTKSINAYIGQLLRDSGFICVGPYYKREYISSSDHVQSLVLAEKDPVLLSLKASAHLSWTWDVEWYKDSLWLVPLPGRRFLTAHNPTSPMVDRWLREQLPGDYEIKGIDLNTGKYRSILLKDKQWGTEMRGYWEPLEGNEWRVCLDMESLENLGYSIDAFHSAQFTFDKLHTALVKSSPFTKVITTTNPSRLDNCTAGVIDGQNLRFGRGKSRILKDVHRLGILQHPPSSVRLLAVASDNQKGDNYFRDILAAHLVDRSLLTAHSTGGNRLKSIGISADNDSIVTIWASNKYGRGFGLPPFSLAKTKLHFFKAATGELLDIKELETEKALAKQENKTLVALVILDDDTAKSEHDRLMHQFRGMKALPLKISNLSGESGSFSTWVNLTLSLAQKAGAIPWDLTSIAGVDEQTVFVGIDLGHDHKRNRSRVAFTLFNYQGRPIDNSIIFCDQNNERIPAHVLLKKLPSFVFERNCPVPTQVIIHRDGRYLDGECDDFLNGLQKVPRLTLVAIKKDTCSRFSAEQVEGTYMKIDERRTILVSNTQSKYSSMPSPLEIELMHSNCLSLMQVTSQVFWLTRVCQGNAYFPKRLPATTHLANSVARTGNRVYLKGWEYVLNG